MSEWSDLQNRNIFRRFQFSSRLVYFFRARGHLTIRYRSRNLQILLWHNHIPIRIFLNRMFIREFALLEQSHLSQRLLK